MLCLLYFVLFFLFLSAGLFSEFFSPLSPPDCNDNAFFSFLSSSLQEKKIQDLNMNSKWSEMLGFSHYCYF